MIGPTIELVLERYSSTDDGGGSSTKSWTSKRRIRGILVSVRGDTIVSEGRETVRITHKFWTDYQKGIDISEKDEFSRSGYKERYRVVYVDDTLAMEQILIIELMRIK